MSVNSSAGKTAKKKHNNIVIVTAEENSAAKDKATAVAKREEQKTEEAGKDSHASLLPGDTVGARLKYARKASGTSLKKAAKVLGAHYTVLYRKEEGVSILTLDLAEKLAELYGYHLSDVASPEEIAGMRTYEASEEGERKVRRMEMAKANREKNIPKRNRHAASADTSKTEEMEAEKQTSAPVPEAGAGSGTFAATSQETAKIVEIVRKKRETRGFSASDMAVRMNMPENIYIDIEEGRRDMTITCFLSSCKILRLRPEHIVGDVIENRWFTFTSNLPMEVYAVMGMCEDHKIEYVPDTSNGCVELYGDPELITKLCRNMGFKGNLV